MAKQLEELVDDPKYAGRVNFLLINCQSVEQAKTYASQHGIRKAPHCSGSIPADYDVRYIPHRTLIGKDGKVLKNYEGFQWSDIDTALFARADVADDASERTQTAVTISQAFAKFDINGDGLIDPKELVVVLEQLNVSGGRIDSLVKDVFRKADADRDGRLDYAEFTAWIYGADSGRVRRALGLASRGLDGGLAQCANMCGRAPFKHFKTCCTHCKGIDGPHAKSCAGAEPSSETLSCRNGCGRKPFGDYATCCTRCTGRDGPHARSCNSSCGRKAVEAVGSGGDTTEMVTAKDVGLTKIFGQELLRGDGTKVPTGKSLSACCLVGILFTATW